MGATQTTKATRRGYDFVQAELKARATRAAKKAAVEPTIGDVLTHTNRKGNAETCTVVEMPRVNPIGVAWVRVAFTDKYGYDECIPVRVSELSRAS